MIKLRDLILMTTKITSLKTRFLTCLIVLVVFTLGGLAIYSILTLKFRNEPVISGDMFNIESVNFEKEKYTIKARNQSNQSTMIFSCSNQPLYKTMNLTFQRTSWTDMLGNTGYFDDSIDFKNCSKIEQHHYSKNSKIKLINTNNRKVV